ncbi:MAG TPA: TetR/AcrR family transcriptional regulator [Acidimicrobiales bacterium]|nr:TetR/AcrR family transcriptional regulator [Acidimicrobiales bacterium]
MPVNAVTNSASPDPSERSTVEETQRVDGRRLRGERTRARVLDALLALVEEGELHPTAQAVATRAGVALRTVYHHFEDVEALRGMALHVQLERHRENLLPVAGELPLRDRISHVVNQVQKFFEAITPIRRATLFDETDAFETSSDVAQGISMRRAFVEESFRAELDGSTSKRELLDAIDVTTSWHNWYYLRQNLGRSVNAAEGIVEIQLRTLLDAA